jgi:hypothetical protein
MNENVCPNCNGSNITFQRESSGSVGASTNKVVIEKPKKSKGCLYWMCIGWWWEPFRYICFTWWIRLLFGGKERVGFNVNANKTLNYTIAVCQDCGHSWKVK